MANPTKLIDAFALNVALEPIYGQGAVITGSVNGIQMGKDVTFQLDYLSKGTRMAAPGSYGQLKQNIKSGRSAKGNIICELKGQASAFTTSSQTIEFHELILASGFSASYASATWSYNADAAGLNVIPASVAMQVYSRRELTSISGGMCNMTIKADAGKAAEVTFAVEGLAGILPQDVATVPQPFYSCSAVLPALLENANFLIGNYSSSVIQSFEFDMGRKLTARPSANAPLAHAGFVADKRDPVIKLKIEAPLQNQLDVHQAMDVGTVMPITCVLPGNAGSNFGFNFANAQITAVASSVTGLIATWDITFGAYLNPTGSGNDDVIITVF